MNKDKRTKIKEQRQKIKDKRLKTKESNKALFDKLVSQITILVVLNHIKTETFGSLTPFV